MKKTVIFDFDGTLADSLNVIVEIFEQLTGRQGTLTKEEMATLRHLPIPVVAQKIGVPMWRVPFLLWRGRRMMRARINEVVLYQGLDDIIQNLHKRGYRLLVVSSNSTYNVRSFLRNNGLDKYFAHIYGGVGLFAKAPALRRILLRNRVHNVEAVYIGDETRDIEACESIGLKCIAVEWGFADPKFLARHNPIALVKTPRELKAAILAVLR
jgi:phosphoglycolate phosphatase